MMQAQNTIFKSVLTTHCPTMQTNQQPITHNQRPTTDNQIYIEDILTRSQAISVTRITTPENVTEMQINCRLR